MDAVGAATLELTVTASVVTDSLRQPDAFTQAKVKEVVPSTDVVIVNEANVAGVVVELVPPPTAAVIPSVPVVPDVAPVPVPPIELLPAGVVEAVDNKQLVRTVSVVGPVLPWQIDTEPEPPPATTKPIGIPFTAVNEARFGRSTIDTDNVVIELGQAPLKHVSV